PAHTRNGALRVGRNQRMKQILYALVAGSTVALLPGAGVGRAAGVSLQRLYATAQSTDAGITQTRVLGEVTAIEPGKQMTVKTDAGSLVTVILDGKTEYLRVPPGETSLEKAIKIDPSEVGVGDKI